MPAFGSFALLLALVLAAYNLLAGALALRLLATGRPTRISPEKLAETARRAGIAGFVAITAAAFALVWCALTDDFSVAYILHHSNRALPKAYKFAALWSGQEGSLVLWAWLLGIYGFVLRLRHRIDVNLHAYAGTILAGIQVFFLLLVNFVAPPFALTIGDIPVDGFGLNPLLQYPEMVIHPPMLYLGYVGFTIPFCFGLAALMMRYPGEKWIQITRRWTMVTWIFLTVGIFLGMHWAYAVLGWGGYWGWDPVENASLMPWITGTAFLHSVMMQERRGMMKNWNVWLIFSTFLLSILGTLLTRSGIVSSVHAFAQSSIGDWFVGFLILTLVICIFSFVRNYDHLQSEHKLESLVSRESAFLFNSLILLALCFTVLWGTLFPVLSEYVQGTKVTVGAPFYNRVAVPIGLFLLLLVGVGPLLPWRSSSLRAIRKNFLWPNTAALIVMTISFLCITQPWIRFAAGERQYPWSDQATFYAWIGFSLATFVLTAILNEFLRGASVIRKHTGRNLFSSTWLLVRRNTRRYGGYTVHVGLVLTIVGLCGSAFNQNVEKEMAVGDSINIGPYKLVSMSYTQESNANYETEFSVIDVYRDGKKVTEMDPEKRVYIASQQPQTMVANHSTPLWDLYLVYEGKNVDTGQPIIKAFLNPLVVWIWIGLVVMVFGSLIALTPSLSSIAAAPRATAQPEAAVVTGGKS